MSSVTAIVAVVTVTSAPARAESLRTSDATAASFTSLRMFTIPVGVDMGVSPIKFI